MYYTLQGELEHRRGKRYYKRVNKGKFIVGIGKQVRRERYFHRTRALRKSKSSSADKLLEESLPSTPTSLEQHHHISSDTRSKIILPVWLNQHKNDPALLVCLFFV